MSSGNFASRQIPIHNNIRQRFRLKYSKHGKFNWNKWTEYDCIFASYIDPDRNQHSKLELHSNNNLEESSGKVIDLTQLHSLTSVHGDKNKDEPKSIMILKINGKKHRFGFDHIYEFNQWKTLLDGVYNSELDTMKKDRCNENQIVNTHYESTTAKRYRVQCADLATQEILSLPNGSFDLIIDTDKLVVGQRHDRRHIFPRSTIRSIRFVNSDIEVELGSRAPIQGLISFRFESCADANACFLQWQDGIAQGNMPQRIEYPKVSQSVPLRTKYNDQLSLLPRSRSIKRTYYNVGPSVSSTANDPTYDYAPFHTLV
ncbi:unnamed protein product [Rotaria socialis]|uniref:Uncharacterized protein n=1 Tax=Rotaria socialis TaxID=392032 RepID=A0A817S8S7_9BILA|nr:unnamed protein product [Rotaria socialis]CAF3383064.1 unnamed protein product [Rotaria socialis]CAF3416554.1 unnamed protein product [Rotaria socialis]CAF4120201.1 unnamed protein product [Rotaria socialis]CAF4192661.1 unnamed protein product [Rotaria socialis]